MVVKASIFWRAHTLPKSTGLLAVDVLAKSPSNSTPPNFHEARVSTSSSDIPIPAQFFLGNLERSNIVTRFLLPTVSGYLTQSDFLDRRLVDCIDVVKVQGFLSLNQHFEGITIDECKGLDLINILEYAVGAITISTTSEAWSECQITRANEELMRRFSYPWYDSTPLPKRRIAAIRPGPVSTPHGIAKLEDVAAAAASLNIELVMFDDPCHGLASAHWTHLREHFVPMDMTVTDDLSERIVKAVAAYPKPFDGILCMYEGLLPFVAKAATLLKLPTSSVEALTIARDKYKTRLLDQGLFVRLLQNHTDLEDFINGYSTVAPLSVPLIVKPVDGWASEGVFKVASEEELRDAVGRIWNPTFSNKYGRASQSPIVVEPYVDGPEVDANMVLVDGEIAFFECNDDFPSSGDNGEGSFVEVLNAIPSALPDCEISAIRRKVHKILLDMGFCTGVYHVEARVHNSAKEYVKGGNGSIDLYSKPTSANITKTTPAVYILEINPRPPGWWGSLASNRTYGISFQALSLLTAVGDRERMRAISVPFIGGAQYYLQDLFIPVQKGGVYQSGDVCAQVFEREPELRSHVMYCMGFLKNGQEVGDPRTGRMGGAGIGFFHVASRESRQEARSVCERIETLVMEITGGF